MRYDLALLEEFCRETGLEARIIDPTVLEVPVGDGAVLCFVNSKEEKDCFLGFHDTSWHVHGDVIFNGPNGHYIEVDLLSLLSGLKDGQILVCELRENEILVDRWLIHSEYNDELSHLQPGQRIIVRRAEVLESDSKLMLTWRVSG
jgi:hypothetical protein